MKQCANCGAQMDDAAQRCPQCGAAVAQAAPIYQPEDAQGAPVPVYVDPADHTAEYAPQDIAANKLFAMAAYVFGWMGIIVALLGAGQSAYVQFHVRQAMKLSILSLLLGFAAAVLCWTLLVPIAAGVCELILFVLRIMGFVDVCQNTARELPIVKGFGFLN